MRIREYLQENRDNMGTAGTLTYDLAYTDIISELVLRFRATNGAGANLNNPIETCITKIELVDGGEVLWDSPGDVALATESHLRNSLPYCYRTSNPSDGQKQVIPIRFGRHLYDNIYAFNPQAHRNPQLRITFDEDTIRDAGSTGFLSDSFDFSLLVRLMEDAPAPTGFLSLRELDTFTTVTSGDHTTSVPTDRVIRALVCRNYEDGVGIETDIDKYKLTADGGKFVAFDMYPRNFLDVMCETFKPILIPHYGYNVGATTFQTWIAKDLESFLRGHQASIIVTATSNWGSRIIVTVKQHDGTASGGASIHLGVIGWGFHNCLIYPFGGLDKPEQWLDARQFSKLDLVLSQGSDGAEVNVVVQQVYQY